MEAALWYVLSGTRGGPNRARVLRAVEEQPRNPNQLAEALSLNCDTVRQHLEMLAENGFSLYYYLVDPTLSAWFSTSVPDPAWHATLLFHVLETLALAFLAWVTFD